jgi:hypothetical protein
MLVVLPQHNYDQVYAEVKKLAFEATVPIPSQCMRAPGPRDERGLMSKLTKVAVQLSAKMNAHVYVAPKLQSLMSGFGPGPYMVCGVDEEGGMASMVYSLNNTVNHFAPVFAPLASGFGRGSLPVADLLQRAILGFATKNGVMPSNILILRAGASDGRVVQHIGEDEHGRTASEVTAVRDMLNGPLGMPDARFVYVVVNARPDARFGFEGDNVLPGTMVTEGVCEDHEFYLVANSTRAGTARPIKCGIVGKHNVEHAVPDMRGPIAEIVNNLCMLFFNWSGAVRLPAPLLGARKAVEMYLTVEKGANLSKDNVGAHHPDTAAMQKISEACMNLGQIFL